MKDNKEEIIPTHVYDTYKRSFNTDKYPNIVRTKNITKDGVNALIEKNNLVWSNSIHDSGYIHLEGIVNWGADKVSVFFKKIENDSTYKLYILTDNLDKINMLLVGLNKFFTIDKI
jgi:hypothetical protein